VPWQNGRILFLNDSSNWILRLYSLKSILPWRVWIWQNGRILFEKACQTDSNFQILLGFCRETKSRGVGSQTEFGNQESGSSLIQHSFARQAQLNKMQLDFRFIDINNVKVEVNIIE
jgi:hypothetical protein